MILRVVVIILVLYFLYRLLEGKLAIDMKKADNPNKKGKDAARESVMVECRRCSVFVDSKEAVYRNGRSYCSKECAEND